MPIIRTPTRLIELADALDVQNNFAFLPHRRLIGVRDTTPPDSVVKLAGTTYEVTSLLTLCNTYVTVFTAGLGCTVPPFKANDQKVWLAGAFGQAAGWFSCNRAIAIQRAGGGSPTVMAVTDSPHGHIAIVMPSPQGDPNTVYVSAAGKVNLKHGPAIRSFGALEKSAVYFTRN